MAPPDVLLKRLWVNLDVVRDCEHVVVPGAVEEVLPEGPEEMTPECRRERVDDLETLDLPKGSSLSSLPRQSRYSMTTFVIFCLGVNTRILHNQPTSCPGLRHELPVSLSSTSRHVPRQARPGSTGSCTCSAVRILRKRTSGHLPTRVYGHCEFAVIVLS